MSVGIIFLLILALLLVIFTLQNTVLISLKVFLWEVTDVPLVLALVICLILGFILAFLLTYPKIWKLKSQLKEKQRIIKELEVTQIEKVEKPHAEGIEMDDSNEKSFFKE